MQLFGRTQTIILILHVVDDLNVFMDCSRDESFLSWEVLAQETIDDECASKTPDIEHVVDLCRASDMGLKLRIDLCGPVRY